MENQPAATVAEVDKPIAAVSPVKKLRSVLQRKSVILALVILAILGALYYFKGIFIAAIVNGSPISRWSIISELEKRSGQQALDALVTKKLIDTEAAKKGIVVSQADVDKEIQTLEARITKQGGTLALALSQQGLTEAQLREQILLQKELEKILSDVTAVYDDEVTEYLAKSKTPAPTGVSDADFKTQIKEQLQSQKFGTEADKWITDAKAKANITYFVDYGMPAASIAPPAASGGNQ